MFFFFCLPLLPLRRGWWWSDRSGSSFGVAEEVISLRAYANLASVRLRLNCVFLRSLSHAHIRIYVVYTKDIYVIGGRMERNTKCRCCVHEKKWGIDYRFVPVPGKCVRHTDVKRFVCVSSTGTNAIQDPKSRERCFRVLRSKIKMTNTNTSSSLLNYQYPFFPSHVVCMYMIYITQQDPRQHYDTPERGDTDSNDRHDSF